MVPNQRDSRRAWLRVARREGVRRIAVVLFRVFGALVLVAGLSAVTLGDFAVRRAVFDVGADFGFGSCEFELDDASGFRGECGLR